MYLLIRLLLLFFLKIKNMKNYKLKAPIIVNILLVVCVILAGVSVGWNVFNVYEYSKVDLVKTVCFSVAIALSLLLFVFCISFFFGYQFKKAEGDGK